MPRLIVTLLVCLFSLSASAESKQQIDKLIAQLGDRQWKVRAAATRALIKIGKPAAAQVKLATRSKNLEVSVRAKQILAQILVKGLEPIQFRIIASAERTAKERARRKKLGKKYRVATGYRWFQVCKREPDLGRKPLLVVMDKLNWTTHKFEHIGVDPRNLQPVVTFSFKPKWRKQFGDFTEKHIARKMAIIFQDKVVSAPTIQSRIEGSGILVGLLPRQIDYLRALLAKAQKK